MERKNRTEVKIHLDNLANNMKIIRSYVSADAEVIAVVKDDAYGHGAKEIAKTLLDNGATRFAVGFWPEGKALREAGIKEPIHVLSDALYSDFEEVVEYGLQPSIYTIEAAKALNEAAVKKEKTAELQLAIDTGMNRIGFKPGAEALSDIIAISKLPNLKVAGAFTHFANADEPENPKTDAQFKLFCDFCSEIEGAGIEIPFKQAANSAAILLHPHVHLDGARAGEIIYGLPLFEGEAWEKYGFKEVMEWDTYVCHVKTVPAGSEIGYSGTFVTEKETVIATVPVGHGDGFRRQLSNKGMVKIRGKLAPIIGLICMDTFMVDVTDIEGVERGDRVILMGEELSAAKMGELLGISLDEIVEVIHPRVPRVYVE